MKRRSLLYGLIALCLSMMSIQAQQLAFPEAVGFGRFAVGGRTGTVYHVTNLNDTGTGSLRDAVSKSNRIVVFDVAGVIRISSRISVASNLYIAGQTAPGEGITVYGNGFSFSNADNTICRYLRVRMGSVGDSGKDALGIAEGHDIIFDHVSVSWGRDETFSISGSECTDITIQNSLIAQGLLSHSAGGLIQPGGGVTLYRNFYVDNSTRNNKVKGINQYVNNIVYNWKDGAYIMGGNSEGHMYVNVVSNYFVKGTLDGANPMSGGNERFHIYADDNWSDNNQNGVLDGYLIPESEYSGGPDFQEKPYDYPALPTLPAVKLIDSILPGVGASLPYRDYVDYYVIDELMSFGEKGAFITSESELPFGAPDTWSLWTGTAKTDSDKDGIPDSWEDANGLNKNSASDAMTIAANGYANIENYINSITGDNSQAYLRDPMNLITDSAAQTSLKLAWFDYTEKESGYIIEQKINGVFTQIATTGINENSYLVSDLVPETAYQFRVKAFNGDTESGYSNDLSTKTKPVPVEVLDPDTFTPDLTWLVGDKWDLTSNNWIQGANAVPFTSNSSVLFSDLGSSDQTISLAASMPVSAMFVKAEADYTFNGNGAISGDGSVNKTGSGKLALLTNNTYNGATVVWDGTLEINKLANGGAASSIGASPNYAFNWVWKGGKINYTGSTVATDRDVALDENSEFAVSKGSATVTFNGSIAGSGGLTKSGSGSMVIKGENPYEGTTTVSEGVLEMNGITAINSGFGTSGVLNLNGGSFITTGGATSDYEYYYMDINVADGTTSSFEPFRNCYIKSKVKGSGTLNFNINYVREYIQGDWSQFSGVFKANGNGSTSDGNQLMLNNTVGLPNAHVVTSGNVKIVSWKNAQTMYLGGLSGPAGTYLSCADKNNNSATMTWVVGGAGIDETEQTFNGTINNECSNRRYAGVTSIVKEGQGIWRLTADNTYAGTTVVNGGTLVVNGTPTGTAAYTVNDGGILAGKGTIKSPIAVQAGGGIAPGDSSVSTLNVASLTLKSGSVSLFDIDKSTNTYDKIVSSAKVTFAGTLDLNIKGELAVGNQFVLFSSSTMSGKFTKITHNVPNMDIEFSFMGGILRVVSMTETTSISEGQASVVSLFPNPVVEQLTVAFGNGGAKRVVAVYNQTGNLVVQKNSKEATMVIDFSDFTKGIYMIHIISEDGMIETKKVVK